MAYYTGIDVSLRSVSICVVDDKGEVCFEAKVEAEIDAIVDRLRRFSSEVKSVGFEAGTLTQYLTYGLQAAGFEVICLEARQVSVTLTAMRNKTDRNDARGLAHPQDRLVQPGPRQEPDQCVPRRRRSRRLRREARLTPRRSTENSPPKGELNA